MLRDGEVISSDELAIRQIKTVNQEGLQITGRRVSVYAKRSDTVMDVLAELGIEAQAVNDVPQLPDTLFIIPPGGSDAALNRQAKAMRDFLEQGGRVLCLAQGEWPRWSPVKLGFWSAMRDVPYEFRNFGYKANDKKIYFSRHAPILAHGHPAFEGLEFEDLRWWNPFDGRVSDDALVRPSSVNEFSQGAWRVLAGASRPENASVVEVQVGKGTLIFCQAKVIEEWQNPEAQILFVNLLRYLDGPNWTQRTAGIHLAGALKSEMLAKQIGADRSIFGPVEPSAGALMIATDGASISEIHAFAQAGGTVLILSAEVAERLPRFTVERKTQEIVLGKNVMEKVQQYSGYFAARQGEPHPLFWGVNSSNSMNAREPFVEGEFTQYPEEARVLLQGMQMSDEPSLWTAQDLRLPRNPVAVSIKAGPGELIVTTLAPWKSNTAQANELLSLIMANAGVPIAPPERQSQLARALRTVPLKIDGQLNDWTNDVEDKNVSPYCHAIPILLPAEDAIAGSPASDVQFSAIAYFLWDKENLYTAGCVFGECKDIRGVVRLGAKTLTLNISSEGVTAALEGDPSRPIPIAGITLDIITDVVDARLLSFTQINKRMGQLEEVSNVPVRTYEMQIPWQALDLSCAPEQLPVLVCFERADGMVLQSPADANSALPETWIKMAMQ